MSLPSFCRRVVLGVLLLGEIGVSGARAGEVLINEIHFNAGMAEFIELRGEPGASLAGYYLVFLNSEGEGAEQYGTVDIVLDLRHASLSPDGYALFLPKEFPAPVPAGPGVYQNRGSGPGFGGGESTIGWSQDHRRPNNAAGLLNDDGFTALLIRVNNGSRVPQVGDHYDGGLDEEEGTLLAFPSVADWRLVDSIGVQASANGAGGRLYGIMNFVVGDDGAYARTLTGASLCVVNDPLDGIGTFNRIEYVGRRRDGDSSEASLAYDPGDWLAANLKGGETAVQGIDFIYGAAQGLFGDYASVATVYTTARPAVTDTPAAANHP